MIKRLVADDVTEQSRQVLEVIKQEGVAIIPLDVAYAIVGNSKKSIETIFKCKNRSFKKPSGMFSNYELLKDIQVIASWKHDIIKAVIFDNDLPMSTVAPFKPDHPMFRNVDSWVLKNSTKIGTLDMLLNAGEFHNEMTKQSMELEMPVLGSSANTSLTGSKYNLDDIDPPVFAAADILIDGGTSKYKNEKGRSSTIIDFGNFETIRIGVCYDKIRYVNHSQVNIPNLFHFLYGRVVGTSIFILLPSVPRVLALVGYRYSFNAWIKNNHAQFIQLWL